MQYSIPLIRSLHKIASLIESTMDQSFDGDWRDQKAPLRCATAHIKEAWKTIFNSHRWLKEEHFTSGCSLHAHIKNIFKFKITNPLLFQVLLTVCRKRWDKGGHTLLLLYPPQVLHGSLTVKMRCWLSDDRRSLACLLHALPFLHPSSIAAIHIASSSLKEWRYCTGFGWFFVFV